MWYSIFESDQFINKIGIIYPNLSTSFVNLVLCTRIWTCQAGYAVARLAGWEAKCLAGHKIQKIGKTKNEDRSLVNLVLDPRI